MRIAITGATGFVGVPLVAALRAEGHEVVVIGRRRPGSAPDVAWDPEGGVIDRSALNGVEAVVHLAGEPIGERWTPARKAALRSSRVKGTSLIATTMAALSPRPRVLVSMSAIGIYGNRGDEELTEASPPARDFLGELGVAWESAADPARAAGIRVVHPRLGIVLHQDGGALAKMLPPFRLGLGGRLGAGTQYMSWISRADAVAALQFALTSDSVQGPVNVTAPAPVTNATFTQELGRALHRPAVAVVPEFAIRLMFGEMGEQTVLAGQRVHPQVLLDRGFRFRHPDLPSALRFALGAV
ncbi:MAG: TIGR01777 family protein [Gemmatimonadetes bacterium]|nr:TIGR01777 family protein [Gemmatimonadota bacterium]